MTLLDIAIERQVARVVLKRPDVHNAFDDALIAEIQAADVVVVQGGSKETLRLFGDPHSVTRVRAAMFNASVSWTPIELE